jgi:hypothetical protein
MAQGRFRTSRESGTGLVLPTLDALLDALEAGRLGPEDVVFDVQLQTWMPAKDHPELRAAWLDRQRYRPLDDRTALARLPDARLAYPALDDVGVTPAHGITVDDLEARRAAFRAMRASPPPTSVPSPHAPATDVSHLETLMGHTALVAVLLLLGLVGWSIVGLASGIGKLLTLGAWGR